MAAVKKPPENYKGYQFKFRLTDGDRQLLTDVASPVQWRLFCLGIANLVKRTKPLAAKKNLSLEDVMVKILTSSGEDGETFIRPLVMVLTDPDFKGLTNEMVDEFTAKVMNDIT